ncbi:MAG: thiamine phosphate synthase [Vicinamibacteria bacterium]|nr:thiamine phosphate synthase [Vicinamibacteria bacterium]
MSRAIDPMRARLALTWITAGHADQNENALLRMRSAAVAGLDFIQVREKQLSGKELIAFVRRICAAVAGTSTRVLINSRPDVALAAGAAGVQLPEEGLPVSEVKALFPQLVVGVSCHSLAAVLAAQTAGADFALLGPVFTTPGKEARSLGRTALAEIVRSVTLPIHVVGGVDLETARVAASAGARGVAAVRLFQQGDVSAMITALRTIRSA